MARYTYDREAAERRVTAYVDFLMTAYDTDAHGLADVAGIPRGTLTKFISAPWEKKSVTVFFTLAQMTGVSVSFLFAEEPEAAEYFDGVLETL